MTHQVGENFKTKLIIDGLFIIGFDQGSILAPDITVINGPHQTNFSELPFDINQIKIEKPINDFNLVDVLIPNEYHVFNIIIENDDKKYEYDYKVMIKDNEIIYHDDIGYEHIVFDIL